MVLVNGGFRAGADGSASAFGRKEQFLEPRKLVLHWAWTAGDAALSPTVHRPVHNQTATDSSPDQAPSRARSPAVRAVSEPGRTALGSASSLPRRRAGRSP